MHPNFITRSVAVMLRALDTELREHSIFELQQDLAPLIRIAKEQEYNRDDKDDGESERGQELIYLEFAQHEQDIPGSSSQGISSSAQSSAENTADPGQSTVLSDPSPKKKRKRGGCRGHQPSAKRTGVSLVQTLVGHPRRDKNHDQRHKQKQRFIKRMEHKSASRFKPPPFFKIRKALSLRPRETTVLQHDLDSASLKHASTSYRGLPQHDSLDHDMDIDTLRWLGYTEIKWEGKDTLLLVDSQRRLIIVGLPPPEDQEVWRGVMREFVTVLEAAKGKIRFPEEPDRRGPFSTITVGISYGGGQKRPGVLVQENRNLETIEQMLGHPVVQRVAHWQNAGFAAYFPGIYKDYYDTIDALHDMYPHLKRNFPHSVFPAAAFNFPPDSHSIFHTDFLNRAAGICMITAAGEFDFTKGGHLVFQDYKLVIQFPSGCTFGFPSASCKHGNTPVNQNEVRASFTQFAAGGIFQYVDNGFRSCEEIKGSNPREWKEILKSRENKWMEDLLLYSTVESLHYDRSCVGMVNGTPGTL